MGQNGKTGFPALARSGSGIPDFQWHQRDPQVKPDLYTALSGKLKWQKNIQSISRLLRERPHPGLRNEPPLDSLDPQSLNPFMASLWIGSEEGLAIHPPMSVNRRMREYERDSVCTLFLSPTPHLRM